jgi:transcriptional regulator with XRE-family HTH domain
MSSSLGQRIVHYRKRAGISQKNLAATVGISSSALNNYEKGKREPNISVLMRLAEALDITGDALLGLDPHPELVAQNGGEYIMLRAIRGLNKLGRDRALEFISGLKELPKYVS